MGAITAARGTLLHRIDQKPCSAAVAPLQHHYPHMLFFVVRGRGPHIRGRWNRWRQATPWTIGAILLSSVSPFRLSFKHTVRRSTTDRRLVTHPFRTRSCTTSTNVGQSSTLCFQNWRKHSLFKILIDTCVWLDLAKDYQQQAILAALEELIRQGDVSLILPSTVVDEFARNKARLIEENTRSLSSTLKRVKEAVEKFGDSRQKAMVLRELNDVDHRLPTLGETAVGTVNRIEKLFSRTPVVEISDAVKLRAAHVLSKSAPPSIDNEMASTMRF